MWNQGNHVVASAPKRSDAGLHNQAVWRLPAWAFEKLLARAWRAHAEEGSAILRLAFPPGTPVAYASADFPQYKHLAVPDSLMPVFDGWDCQVLGEDDTDGLPPPYYRHFEVSPTDKRLAYESACLRLSHPGGQQAAALITLAVPDGECRTIAEVQEQAIRCLQRAIENGLDPAAVAVPGDLPSLDQPQPVEESPIGFKAKRQAVGQASCLPI